MRKGCKDLTYFFVVICRNYGARSRDDKRPLASRGLKMPLMIWSRKFTIVYLVYSMINRHNRSNRPIRHTTRFSASIHKRLFIFELYSDAIEDKLKRK